MHPDFYKFDPNRPPTWRFDRILTLLDDERGPRQCSRYDDKFTRNYHRFLAEYRHAEQLARVEVERRRCTVQDTPQMLRLFSRRAGEWYAYRMFNHVDREARAIVQARILSREGDEQIAARLGTLPETVKWYEKVFFDVRDRLNATDYIAKVILGGWEARQNIRGAGGAINEAQRDLLYMLFAYQGGPYALEGVMTGFSEFGPIQRAGDAEQWFEKTLRHLVKVKAVMALEVCEINKFNALEIVNMSLSLMEAEKTAGNDEKRKSALESAVADLLSEVPFELALRKEGSRSPLEAKYSEAVEPRVSEAMLIAAGTEPEQLLLYQDRIEQEFNGFRAQESVTVNESN